MPRQQNRNGYYTGVGHVPDCLMSFRQHYPVEDTLDQVLDVVPGEQESVHIRRFAKVALNIKTVHGTSLPKEICLTVRKSFADMVGGYVMTPNSHVHVGILQILETDDNVTSIRPIGNGKMLCLAKVVPEVNIVIKFNCSILQTYGSENDEIGCTIYWLLVAHVPYYLVSPTDVRENLCSRKIRVVEKPAPRVFFPNMNVQPDEFYTLTTFAQFPEVIGSPRLNCLLRTAFSRGYHAGTCFGRKRFGGTGYRGLAGIPSANILQYGGGGTLPLHASSSFENAQPVSVQTQTDPQRPWRMPRNAKKGNSKANPAKGKSILKGKGKGKGKGKKSPTKCSSETQTEESVLVVPADEVLPESEEISENENEGILFNDP